MKKSTIIFITLSLISILYIFITKKETILNNEVKEVKEVERKVHFEDSEVTTNKKCNWRVGLLDDKLKEVKHYCTVKKPTTYGGGNYIIFWVNGKRIITKSNIIIEQQ